MKITDERDMQKNKKTKTERNKEVAQAIEKGSDLNNSVLCLS